jgi:hypothetical protein
VQSKSSSRGITSRVRGVWAGGEATAGVVALDGVLDLPTLRGLDSGWGMGRWLSVGLVMDLARLKGQGCWMQSIYRSFSTSCACERFVFVRACGYCSQLHGSTSPNLGTALVSSVMEFFQRGHGDWSQG